MSGETLYLKKGIYDIAMQKAPNGLTYGLSPTMAHNCILPDYSLTWILTLWDYYWQTGDITPYLDNKSTIDGLLKYFESHKNAGNGLLSYDSRYWLFLDWTNIQKEGEPALLSLWYVHALDKLRELAEVAQDGDSAARYAELSKGMRKAIETALVDKSNGLVCNGILPDGKRNPKKGVHAQTLAVL